MKGQYHYDAEALAHLRTLSSRAVGPHGHTDTLKTRSLVRALAGQPPRSPSCASTSSRVFDGCLPLRARPGCRRAKAACSVLGRQVLPVEDDCGGFLFLFHVER